MNAQLDALVQALRDAERGHLIVVTGAGISAASGIPTFRGTDPGAIWKRDVTELGTFRFFREDPVESWRWYLSRFEKVLAARPNAAHVALARLERRQSDKGGAFLLVTQNIDTLHEQAGSKQMVKVHGSADRVRCPRQGCVNGAPCGSLPRNEVAMDAFLAEPRVETLPRCPCCNAVLRQHVLWFDEYYASHDDYQFERVCCEAEHGSLFVFVGTSFSVGITEILLRAAAFAGAPVLSIDPSGKRPDRSVLPIRAPAEEILAAACDALGAP
jgi:NAD-dependent deacetylase